jgi:hypothetical protein
MILSGCNAQGGNSSEVIINHIYVDNIDDKSHVVHVLIYDQEEESPVYLKSKTFEANDYSETGISGGLFKNLPRKPGNYEVWVRLDQREWDGVDVSTIRNLPNQIDVGVSIGYQRKEDGPPAWKVTVSESEKGQSTRQ